MKGVVEFLLYHICLQPSNWIDESLEININEILDICFSIRQLKSEHNITKKHQPKGSPHNCH